MNEERRFRLEALFEEALTLPFVKPAPYLARNHWVQCVISNEMELEMTLLWVRRMRRA